MNSGDRAECPACLSVTAEVAAAQDAGQPCPHCHLPHEALGTVLSARSGQTPASAVDQVITYGRESVVRAATVRRLEGELAAETQRAEAERYRADRLSAELRAFQERADEEITILEADLARARWRSAHVHSAVQDAMGAPFPEGLR